MEETTKKVNQAFAKALLAVRNPELDGVNPHFKSKYATLDTTIKAVRAALSEAGLGLCQAIEVDGERLTEDTTIFDQDGDTLYFSSRYPLPPDCKSNPQKMGSAITYFRRYTLLALFNIVGEEDDDANLATEKPKTKPRQPKQEQARPISRDEKIAIYKAAVNAGLDKPGAEKFTKELTEGATSATAKAVLGNIQSYVDRWVLEKEGGSN